MYGSIACAASPRTRTFPENHLASEGLLTKGHLIVFLIIPMIFVNLTR